MKCSRNSRQSGSVFDLDGAKARVADIELAMQNSDFWGDHLMAGRLAKELTGLKEEVSFWESFEEKLSSSGETEIPALKKQFDKLYVKIFLSGKYDGNNALIAAHSGAGGEDAQDWARMLFEMYRKYCDSAGFGFLILDNLNAEITGRYAYGTLKGETGVHRLVRISPFDANARRHTSFALVEVLPEIEDAKLEIKPEDLRVDTFRSSGPGGQNVNKLETAVRITHVPTNTVVAVQSERSQAQNKEKALHVLQSKLVKLMEEHQAKELSDLRGKIKDQSIEWGNQIRSYVLNPYKQVKDHRTGVESTQPDRVLDGGLDEFIRAEITYDNT